MDVLEQRVSLEARRRTQQKENRMVAGYTCGATECHALTRDPDVVASLEA